MRLNITDIQQNSPLGRVAMDIDHGGGETEMNLTVPSGLFGRKIDAECT